MKSVIAVCVFIISAQTMWGQHYEPQILILAPNETVFDKKLGSELAKVNGEIKKTSKVKQQRAYIKSAQFASQPENFKLMTLAEVDYLENADFFRLTSHFAQQYLSYRFYERFPELLILLSGSKSNGEIEDLKKLSERDKMQFVLNFSNINLFRAKGITYSKIKVQLFDNASGSYLLNKEYTGDWLNPGFEFACPDKSINCTINNALGAALADVIQAITTNNPTIKRTEELTALRYQELINTYYPKSADVLSVKEILREAHSEIQSDHVYHVMFDNQKMKFVAFSSEKITPQQFKAFTENNKDNQVTIISKKSIKDEGFLNSIPEMYAYVIKGVKYQNRWYVEKSNQTYFDAQTEEEAKKEYFSNLQQWNFFREDTTAFNPAFWETQLFSKVRDLKQDPEWENYGGSIWKTEEANNRSYVGLYEIVANELRKAKLQENEKFEKATKQIVLAPVYEKLKNANPKEFAKYAEHSLIYASNRAVAINPVLITNDAEVKTLHYYVIFSNSH
jgi:hypothetical protein